MSTLLFSRRGLFFASLLVVAPTISGSRALAQGHTPDPYNIVGEYNSQYEPYMYAVEPSQEGTVPNQQKYSKPPGTRASSESINGLDDLEGNTLEPAEPSATRRRAGAGTPYYRAALDDDRTFRTNLETDESFFANQRKRSDEYFKAMSVKDPKKRARLLRELNLENLRVSRMLPNFKNSASNKRGETLKFDTVPDPFGDDESPSSSRDAAELRKGSAAAVDSEPNSALRSRSGIGSRSKRPGTSSPARTGSSRASSLLDDSSSAGDSILKRGGRDNSQSNSSTTKSSSNPKRRSTTNKP